MAEIGAFWKWGNLWCVGRRQGDGGRGAMISGLSCPAMAMGHPGLGREASADQGHCGTGGGRSPQPSEGSGVLERVSTKEIAQDYARQEPPISLPRLGLDRAHTDFDRLR